MQKKFFIADLISCSTYFGHHYAHHQELENIITDGRCLWYLVLWFFKLSVWCGVEGYVSGLRAGQLQACNGTALPLPLPC